MVAITVRDVPEKVRDELASRATQAGQSLQQYLHTLLTETAARPSTSELVARARRRVNRSGSDLDTEAILAMKDADRR